MKPKPQDNTQIMEFRQMVEWSRYTRSVLRWVNIATFKRTYTPWGKAK